MQIVTPVFLQGLAFSGGAILLVALSAWWLYVSPLPQLPGALTAISSRLTLWVVALLGLWAIQLVVGAFWDASMHVETGEVPAGADFLWPPHIVIYSAFLMSFTVGAISMGGVALAGLRADGLNLRAWVRRNPYLGAVALASAYSLLSIPGDAVWHELFGVDLTAWSPPHLMLGLMSCAVLVCALGLLAPASAGSERPAVLEFSTIVLCGLTLSVAYMIGVIEWEMPGVSNPIVLARPIWVYPLVGGAIAFLLLSLARSLTRFRWSATAVALVFFALRFGVTFGLQLSGNIAPYWPLWFILGAVLMDLLPFYRLSIAWHQDAGRTAAFTAGYLLLALPLLAGRPELRAFTVADVVLSVVPLFTVCLLLTPIVRLATRLLQRENQKTKRFSFGSAPR